MKFTFYWPSTGWKSLAVGALTASAGTIYANAAISLGPVASSSTNTTHEYLESYSSWIVADLSDINVPVPLEVTTSLTHGFWTQELTFASGFPTLTNGQIFNYQELLTFTGGDRPLDFWTQTITTPGWQWESASIFDSNTSEELTGLAVGLDGATVNFSFSSLAPGTSLIVLGELKYTGADGPALPLTLQTIPETSSILLCIVGVPALLIRKRRN